jgi:hypothetical protein
VGSFLDIAGMLAELFTWIGLGAAVVCFLALLILRAVDGRWIETDAVVLQEAPEIRLRWMSTAGLHERLLSPHERHHVSGSEGLRVYYRERKPAHTRFEASGDGEKTLRLLGFLFLGIGVLALVISIVLVFIPEA